MKNKIAGYIANNLGKSESMPENLRFWKVSSAYVHLSLLCTFFKRAGITDDEDDEFHMKMDRLHRSDYNPDE